jgi:hypothetical protein
MSEEEELEKREKVLVCIRVRPLNGKERREHQSFAWKLSSKKLLQNDMTGGQGTKPAKFSFDKVFNPETSNEDIFDQIGFSSVKAAMNGYHGVIFAYGQTSSGKTYTIHGSEEDPGMIPRSVEAMFEWIENTPSRDFVMRISYLEIYNEVVNDLITPANSNLKVREDATSGVFVENLSESNVMSAEQVFALIAAGESHRHVGRTDYNEVSSRSHTIFRIYLESQSCDPDAEDQSILSAILNLVDLAGSENTSKIGTSGGATRVKETGHINKSLLALATVIRKLSENKPGMHIPFRDSRLTRILQPCLNGESLVSIICAMSPSSGNIEESISTLKFAERAKEISNSAKQNKTISKDSLIAQYKREIEELRLALEAAAEGRPIAIGGSADPNSVSLSALEEMQEQQEEEKAQLNAKIEHLTKMFLRSSNVGGAGDQWDAKGSSGRAKSTIGPAVVQSQPVRKPSYFGMMGGTKKGLDMSVGISRGRSASAWGGAGARKQSVGLNALTGNQAADDQLCLPSHVTNHFVKQKAEEEVARIKEQATGLQGENNKLQERMLEIQGEISDVKDHNASLLETIEDLKSELRYAQLREHDLDEKLAQAEQTIVEYEQEIEDMKSKQSKELAAASEARQKARAEKRAEEKRNQAPAQISITVSCRELPYKKNRNPLVGFFVQQDSGMFEYEGRTEWVQDSCNPIFARKFTIQNKPNSAIRFSVYDVDNEQSIQAGDYIGSCTLQLSDLIAKAEAMGGGLFASAEENQFVPFELMTDTAEADSYLCLKIVPKLSKTQKKNIKDRQRLKASRNGEDLQRENDELRQEIEALKSRLGL